MKRNSKYLAIIPAVLVYACTPGPVRDHAARPVSDSILRLLAESPAHTVLSSQHTIRFGGQQMDDSVLVNGIIVPDERRTKTITARFDGRIEKLYFRSPYEFVHKGDKLMEIYSPGMNTSISEYLSLYNKDKTSVLTQQARVKLSLLGLSDSEIDAVTKKNAVPGKITIYSDQDGYIIPLSTSAMQQRAQDGMNSGMSGMNIQQENSSSATSPGTIREGAYITKGQTLFTLNDARKVIALMSVGEEHSSCLQPGKNIRIEDEILPGSSIFATIDLVEPVFKDNQKFLSVRASLDNEKGELKYNSLVKGTFRAGDGLLHTLPSTCVYDLGLRKIVWVRTGLIESSGVFEPRVVITGFEDGQQTEILSGLNEGEEVAEFAGLLVDREGIIQTDVK